MSAILYIWSKSQVYFVKSHPLWTFSYKTNLTLQTKYNLPSWCDRVLKKSYPLVHAVCQAYGEWFLFNGHFLYVFSIEYDNKTVKQVKKIGQIEAVRSSCSVSRAADCLLRQCEMAVSDRLCVCVLFFMTQTFKLNFQIYRVYHWHHDKWPFTGFCIFWGWSSLAVCFQARYDHRTDISAAAL